VRQKNGRRQRGGSQLDWEFGGDEPVVVRDTVPFTNPRRAVSHATQAAQRHAHGLHRRAVTSPSHAAQFHATQPEPTAFHRTHPNDVEIFMPTADEHINGASPASHAPRQVEEADEDWEHATTADLRDAFRGIEAAPRVRAVRQSLELALDDWWSQQKLVSPALLRNGLLVLEAGNSLDEPHLSLLLRSALRMRRGMLTALRHQTDPDRAAYLLKESLLHEADPLPTSTLWWLRQQDENSDEWAELLYYDLEQDAQAATGARQRLVQDGLRQLESDELLVEPPPDEAPRPWPLISVRPRLWSIGRAVILGLLAVLLLGAFAWNRQRSQLDDVVFIPAGVYSASEPAGGTQSVRLEAFAIDRTEVTNRSYRLCYEQGACPLPHSLDSATREGYFFDPAFDFYPVVNIDWEAANAYCAWAGKRLPMWSEWEVAASIAPATQRRYLYPWGDVFQRQYANSALTNVGDTQRVGLYRPVGSSSFGGDDMAGNVAEWTAFPTDTNAVENASALREAYVVKGGSYRDGPDALRTDAYMRMAPDSAQPWVGFRCTTTISDGDQGFFLFTNRRS
jgi:hypothetical protein